MPNIQDAAELCALLEAVATPLGFHVGVGGGCVNKTGERKDIDILVYRRRDDIKAGTIFDHKKLHEAFKSVGIGFYSNDARSDRWCSKATWRCFAVDILYPEALEDNSYNEPSPFVLVPPIVASPTPAAFDDVEPF